MYIYFYVDKSKKVIEGRDLDNKRYKIIERTHIILKDLIIIKHYTYTLYFAMFISKPVRKQQCFKYMFVVCIQQNVVFSFPS
jgi:chorismate mutase